MIDTITMSFKLVLVVLGFLVCSTTRSHGESSTCLMVYREGGAPAVFQSPKCPRWKLPDHDSGKRAATSTTARCQLAMLQGRRKHMEDRTLCMLDLHIPFPSIFLTSSLFLFLWRCGSWVSQCVFREIVFTSNTVEFKKR